jgi:predicted CXXCH cytochrome family protein
LRSIHDEYELPDDDSGEYGGEYVGALFRRRHRSPWPLVFGVIFLALVAASVYAVIRVSKEQQNDSFCTGCHTAPEQTYVDRSTTARAGALAADLASYHYQQISGQGGTLRCIDCHQGNGSLGHRIDAMALSARNALVWLAGRNDQKTEKLYATIPHLANDGCLQCHQKTLLLAGMANHYHNMLPAAFTLWRNGGSLIAPQGTKDVQAVIAAGLVRYDTSVQCSDCHRSHLTTEADLYLDKDVNVPLRCVQCHREVNKGPLAVSVP